MAEKNVLRPTTPWVMTYEHWDTDLVEYKEFRHLHLVAIPVLHKSGPGYPMFCVCHGETELKARIQAASIAEDWFKGEERRKEIAEARAGRAKKKAKQAD